MRQIFLVTERRGGPWNWSRPLRDQAGFAEHARYMDALVEQGVIVLGGPLDDAEVLLVVDAASDEAARGVLGDDPWIADGTLTITDIRPRTILLARPSP